METRSQEVVLQFVDQRLAISGQSSEAAGAVISRVRKQVVATSVGPTKIFQARSGVYMLMKAKPSADSEKPEFYLATDEVGLLLAVHGVLLGAYVAFLIVCSTLR